MAEFRWRVVLREADKAYLMLECERGTYRGMDYKECPRSLWQQPPLAVEEVAVMWNWDGNVEAPTILPSIDCKGGCLRHFTMIKGVPT